MSSIIRLAIGIGLFAIGFQVGREVGRMEPITEGLRARSRRGIVIDGEMEGGTLDGDDDTSRTPESE